MTATNNSYFRTLRLRKIQGPLEAGIDRVMLVAIPLFASPFQPSEIYDAWGGNSDAVARTLKAQGDFEALIGDLTPSEYVAGMDIRLQRSIDRRCLAFAERLLKQDEPRQLNRPDRAKLDKLVTLAGDSHPTVRWIRGSLLGG
jgi:hypothetical protein